MTIVITQPYFITNEVDAIVRLFDERGIDRLHVRKPEASEDEVAALISSIPACFYPHISIHDHHALAVRYGLGGIHLNSRHPVLPEEWQGLVSISCHSIAELASCLKQNDTKGCDSLMSYRYDYLSLSPIFDSISKQGYHAAFTREMIEDARRRGIICQKVLALGGVTFDRLSEVREMGFGGGMILGDAWR